jgi:hypothetical protein
VRWAASVTLFIALFSALVLTTRSTPTPDRDVEALVEADRQARIAIAQDQAPRNAPLRRGAIPRVALERAIADDVRNRVRRGQLRGPAQGARCGSPRAGRPRRQAFDCTARAGEIRYPFLGVVDVSARRLTWCKRVLPDVVTPDVPVSRRCRE